jgi:hypothetical protein
MKIENLKLRSVTRLQSLARALLVAERFNFQFSILSLKLSNSATLNFDSWIT